MSKCGLKVGGRRVALAVLMAAGVASPLLAQRVPVPAGSRAATGYEALGLPLGGFRVFPTVRATLSYDDNVFLRERDEVGDEFLTVSPRVSVRSNWSSNALNGEIYSTHARAASLRGQNTDQYGVSTNGRLDVQRGFTVSGAAGYAHLAEPRGTAGDNFLTGRNVEYDVWNASAQITKRFNRVGVTAGGGIRDFKFDPGPVGGLFDQGFRDRQVLNAFGRLDYQYSATTSLFVTGSVNRVRYDRIVFVDRASDGYSVLGGVRFELSRLLRGEVAVGFIGQSFRNQGFRNFGGPTYSADIVWEPTPLTTVRFSADRNITDSSLIGVGAVLASRLRADVDHELLRNLNISGYVAYDEDRYRGIERRERRYYAGASARYSFSRYLAGAVAYDRQQQFSSGPFRGRRYQGNRISASVILSR